MTIEEAIRSRLDRFNRLWLAAEGHTFEDDPKVKKEIFDREHPIWEEKVNARAKELGFEDHNKYWAYVCKRQWEDNDPNFERDPIIQDMWAHEPMYTSLCDYEMMVIDEAKGIAQFVIDTAVGGDIDARWNEIRGGKDAECDSITFSENLRKAGYDMDEGHSGNSASCSILFANCLLFEPELFEYLHGALAGLVGDSGYHDDRSDVPNRTERVGK